MMSPLMMSPHHIKEWTVSLTEAETPADIALWVIDTYKPLHHIKEFTVSLTEAESPADIVL